MLAPYHSNSSQSQLSKRQDGIRPYAFAAWGTTFSQGVTHLVFSSCYHLNLSYEREWNVGGIIDGLKSSTGIAHTLGNWMYDTLQQTTAVSDYGQWTTFADIARVADGSTFDFYQQFYQPDPGSVLVVAKVAFHHTGLYPIATNQIAAFAAEWAYLSGLQGNIYHDWVVSNQEPMPPSGWKKREDCPENTFWLDDQGICVTNWKGLVSTTRDEYLDRDIWQAVTSVDTITQDNVFNHPYIGKEADTQIKRQEFLPGDNGQCFLYNPWPYVLFDTPYVRGDYETICSPTFREHGGGF